MAKVEDGMSEDVLLVTPDDTLKDVAEQMDERKVGSAVVDVPNRTAPGIITERDLLRAMAHSDDAGAERVEDYFTKNVTTCGPGWSLEDAASSMLDRGVRHLVVLDDDGEVRGIVSMRDVVRGVIGGPRQVEKIPSSPDE